MMTDETWVKQESSAARSGRFIRRADFPSREGGIHRRAEPTGRRLAWQARGVLGTPFRVWKIAGRAAQSRRLKRWKYVLTLALVWAASLHASGASSEIAARVVILANSDDPDSLRIAHHYAEKRGVPEANIVALPMPKSEAIGWHEFVPTLWNPLLARLVRDGWIDGIEMQLTDAAGRRKYAVSRHRIAALVVCRGVPLRVEHDPSLFAEVMPFTVHPEYRTNAGAVDAELSLLALPTYPINAFLPNPLFQNEHPNVFELEQVVKVSRLDGPTPEDAMALVDHALTVERQGLIGRAYIDLSRRDPIGDRWLDAAASQLEDLGFDLSVDRDVATIAPTARFDQPVIYFGWYTQDVDGPFALPGFRFPPGAIALHIHSYSAATVHSPESGWVGPFLARGVTATFGNVHEPYLQMTQRPDLLVRALKRGANLVDAAYFSQPALSWQEVLIGDPLYRPFAVSFEEQLAKIDELPADLAPYVVLRRVHQLDGGRHHDEALEFLRTQIRVRPSLPLALALAQRLLAAGDQVAAAAALSDVNLLPKKTTANDWGLIRAAAKCLEECHRPAAARDIWRRLMTDENLPVTLRDRWRSEAAEAADAAGDSEQATAWRAPGGGRHELPR
jgi:uncharacterized protein (TIGR03790 family)